MDRSAAIDDIPTDLGFESVIDQAKSLLQAQRKSAKITGGNINRDLVEVRVPDQLAIVGDLHGDLETLKIILSELDSTRLLQEENNKLVFLGDYVDRGSKSAAVLYKLLKLRCMFPESVILMRGNHEAPYRFPFRQHDFPGNLRAEFFRGRELYEKALSVLELLPVAVLVTRQLLMVHGGLPRSGRSGNPKSILSAASENEKVLEEILWNDPRELGIDSPWEKSRRSYGFHFGKPVTESWIKALGIKAVIRGHEPSPGYRISHNGRIMTLFSCRESYPLFQAAYVWISKENLEALASAEDLIPFTHVV